MRVGVVELQGTVGPGCLQPSGGGQQHTCLTRLPAAAETQPHCSSNPFPLIPPPFDMHHPVPHVSQISFISHTMNPGLGWMSCRFTAGPEADHQAPGCQVTLEKLLSSDGCLAVIQLTAAILRRLDVDQTTD